MVPYEAFTLIFGFNSYSALAQHSGVPVTEHFLFRCYPKDLRLLIPLHEKFLQSDWLRAVVLQLNLKYLHVKITTLLWVVV